MLQTDLYSFSYKKGSLLPVCKRCGKEHFYRDGKNKAGIQRYKCRTCGFRFVWTSDLPRRNFFSSIMIFAVEIYTSLRMAASLRGVKQILKKAFNVSVSHETIRQWVLDSKLSIDDNCVPSKTWHADETYFKIKGKGYWLWIVRCKESKHVIAWNISKSHLLKDARFVMQKALEQSKGVKPEKIITDGLWQYPVAIHHGRIILETAGLSASKSKTNAAIASGEFSGWDDPRLITIRALRRRGFQPEAIRDIEVSIGLNTNDTHVSRDMMAAANRRYIDKTSNRYMFVEGPVKITVDKAPAIESHLKNHPDYPERGTRKVSTNGVFYIAGKDFEQLKTGKLYRLMDCLNFSKSRGKFVYKSRTIDEYRQGGERIMHWVAAGDAVPVEVMMIDGSTARGVGESSLKSLNVGDVVQFNRFAFCKLEKKDASLVFVYTHD